LDDDIKSLIRIADAPIVEGTIGAVVQASIGGSLDEVTATAEAAKSMMKL
jgi:phosphoenolpyruvate---glycerone phosphotransferase subunit DhaM